MPTEVAVALALITCLMLVVVSRATIRLNALSRFGIDYQMYRSAVEAKTVGTLVGNKVREQYVLTAFAALEELKLLGNTSRWELLRARLEAAKATPRITEERKEFRLVRFTLAPDADLETIPPEVRTLLYQWDELCDDLIRWLSFLTRSDPVAYTIQTVSVA